MGLAPARYAKSHNSTESRRTEVVSGCRTRRKIEPMRASIIAMALFLPLVAGSSLRAQEPAAENVAEGMRLYRTKADCQACHGWAGDGRKMDTQMPDGANLRAMRLPRAALIAAIKCGRPGRGMPAFDRLAYSDGRCNDLKAADLKKQGLDLPDPAATLQPREIEAIADFLVAKVVNKGPMDHAKCVEFWGSEVDACGEFK
jgi:mono/diheme cytochrome c family protein